MKKHISLILVLLFALAALPLGVLAAGNDYRYATEPVNMRTGPGTRNTTLYANCKPASRLNILSAPANGQR